MDHTTQPLPLVRQPISLPKRLQVVHVPDAPGASPSRLRATDLVLLALFSLCLYSISPLFGRMLSGHESVQPQTSREMFQGGSWLVPTIGGDPWLERPPVPAWVICGVYAIAGTGASETAARFAAVLAAVPIVLLVSLIAGRLYGRSAGLMAGTIFATMHEVYSYSSNPEADVFLALIVTAVIAVFVQLEFGENQAGESTGFLGRRPWLVAAFFVLLGATNLAKGVIFGTVMAGLPIAGFLLWNRSRAQLGRYVWLWGWLAAVAVAAAWPAAVLGQHPELLQLWKEHYGGRLHQGYLREPWWYYAVYTPYVLLPWTLPALLGLWATRKEAFAAAGPERFLWCWAILPPAAFSLADGKHHHYLLQCIAPWAILAVIGTQRIGTQRIGSFCRERSTVLLRKPLLASAVTGAVAATALVCFRHKVPGSTAVLIGIGAFLPLAAFVLVRSLAHPRPRTAFAGVVLVVCASYALWTPYQAAYLDRYPDDAAFLIEAADRIPTDRTVFVQYDWTAPLETFWVLYHTPRPGNLIRDPWQLAERSPGSKEAYILARRKDAPVLETVGKAEEIAASARTRNEKDATDRRVLYRVTFSPRIPPAPLELLQVTRRTLW